MIPLKTLRVWFMLGAEIKRKRRQLAMMKGSENELVSSEMDLEKITKETAKVRRYYQQNAVAYDSLGYKKTADRLITLKELSLEIELISKSWRQEPEIPNHE